MELLEGLHDVLKLGIAVSPFLSAGVPDRLAAHPIKWIRCWAATRSPNSWHVVYTRMAVFQLEIQVFG